MCVHKHAQQEDEARSSLSVASETVFEKTGSIDRERENNASFMQRLRLIEGWPHCHPLLVSPLVPAARKDIKTLLKNDKQIKKKKQ